MASRRLLPAFGLLLLVLVATSRPQRVGDAREYLAMALNLARLEPPALSPSDIVLMQRRLDGLQFTGLPLATPALRAADGRQDFFHFWFYPALAVPGIWLAGLAGLHPNDGFVALNVLLFMGALWIVSKRAAWWIAAVTFCGPVLWWIDKSHTEVFTVSLLAVACVLLREAPWWSMICLGAAATQNLPIAALIACVAATAPLLRDGAWSDARFWMGASVASALALLHPLYYQWRLGVLNPQLLGGVQARVPSIWEMGAVVWDPNVGLLWQVPLLVLVVLAAAATLAVRPRSWMRSPEIWLVLVGAGIFLLSFAQTPNFNHGGTPGISRYALWLIPLAIPILQRAAQVVSPLSQRWFVPLVLASCLSSVVAFHPGWPEHYDSPTRAARIIWERWPWLDHPLPEIFSERTSGREPGLLPVATPGCTKALLLGGQWPAPCYPHAVPPACTSREVLCYANRGEGGYAFIPVARPLACTFDLQLQWAWSQAPGSAVQRTLARLRWQNLRRISPSAPGAMIRSATNVSWMYGLQSNEEFLVYMAQPRQDAILTLRLPGTMAGSLLDPEAGHEIQAVRIDTRPWDLTTVAVPPGRAVALVLTRVR